MEQPSPTHVVIVGGGFAGVACAKLVAEEERVRVTLVDQNGYHQFQPLLYQVATAELAGRDMTFDHYEVNVIYLPLAPLAKVECVNQLFCWWTAIVWGGAPAGYTTL